VGLTTLPPSCADILKILGASNSWSPRVLSRPVQGQLYLFSQHMKYLCIFYNGKVKLSRYRPGQALGVPGG
jgi:hypothetical protein